MIRAVLLTLDTDLPDGLYPEVLLEPGMVIDIPIGEGGLVGQVLSTQEALEALPGAWLAACPVEDAIAPEHERVHRDAPSHFAASQLAQLASLPCRVDAMTPREYAIYRALVPAIAALQWLAACQEEDTPCRI